jgi:multiple sugar transport system substrate-binding protein
MSDLADYLGAKYGGWFNLAELYGRKWGTKDWISLPMGGSTGPSVYRVSWLKEVGYDKIPNDTQGFLEMCQKLKKAGHPAGFSLGHALGDANGYANWLLWIHNAYLVDENNKLAIDSKETIAALKYAAELQKTLIDGTLSWNDAGNNQAFSAGQISLTFNGISIYYALKNSKDPAARAMGEDTSHQLQPTGFAKASSVQTATVINAMLFKHSKYPNAAKEYLRFMMEAPQYGPWLEGSLGYWAEPLKAYGKMAFWNDPKLMPYSRAMDTIYYDGFKGPISPASSAVAANYTLVDMFASVVTGAATPEAAAKQAADAAARYYNKA